MRYRFKEAFLKVIKYNICRWSSKSKVFLNPNKAGLFEGSFSWGWLN